jgi:uncharacterized protein YdhG (YjbR/CyaY superfamily)
MDEAVRDYLDAIPGGQRLLFDRIHQLILQVHPNAAVIMSYRMPTFVVGRHRLYVGVWKHGLSFYGWQPGRDAGFRDRHPDLVTGQGTLKLGPDAAARIPDTELRDFLRATLGTRSDP